MAVSAANLKFYLSGGASNTDPLLSLGGARSTTAVTPSTLFDNLTGDEASTGEVAYRCIYLRNEDATSLTTSVLWIDSQTPGGDDISIALGGEGKNGTAEGPKADEYTAPSGETFSAPANKAAGLSVGDMAQNDYYPVWIKRNVPASTGAYTSNSFTLKWEGDSVA